MRKTVIYLLLLATFSLQAQELTQERQEAVKAFIERVRSGNKDSLAAHTAFPIRRRYPVPYINNKREFIDRYDTIFDQALVRKIVESNPATDWSDGGWRGISFSSGDVWLIDDDQGTLEAVNYQSSLEKKKMVELIAKDRAAVHEPLQQFIEPVYILETETYRIRIDEMAPDNYRYASWKLDKPMSDKPDIIIKKGKFTFSGSGGNYSIEFKNGQYRYHIEIIELGEDDAPPARLYVYKNDKKLLVEDATIVGQ